MFDIHPTPPQISKEHRAALEKLDTGTIGHFLEHGFMSSKIMSKSPGARIAGTAITVRSPYPDSIIGHYALKDIRPGDVLLIDRAGDKRVACWGGLTSVAAAKMGLSGLIIDGPGNDIAQANAAGLPIWCDGIVPVTTQYRGMGGVLNAPICCGGVTVHPGDAILADDNGILVIRPADLQKVIENGRKFATIEHSMLEKLQGVEPINYPELTGATDIVTAALEGKPLPFNRTPINK